MSVLFVFYNEVDGQEKDFPVIPARMPKGWSWTGMGGVGSGHFDFETQFNGPSAAKTKMRECLKQHFDRLQEKGIIAKFKIRAAYLP